MEDLFMNPSLHTTQDVAEQCRHEAEALYRSGSHHCAEAVLATIRNHFRQDLSTDIVQIASGFGGGSGSGCICGAVSAATIGLGLVLRHDKKRISLLTRELHNWFKTKYSVTCCKSIRSTHSKEICPRITGEVAEKVAEMLAGTPPRK